MLRRSARLQGIAPPAPPVVPPPSRPVPSFVCSVCGDATPAPNCVTPAPAGGASCSHRVCGSCFSSHTANEVRATRTPNIRCVCHSPAAGNCGLLFAQRDVDKTLRASPADLVLYHDALARALVPTGRGVYCPHDGCGAFLEVTDDALQADREGGPYAECVRPLLHKPLSSYRLSIPRRPFTGAPAATAGCALYALCPGTWGVPAPSSLRCPLRSGCRRRRWR